MRSTRAAEALLVALAGLLVASSGCQGALEAPLGAAHAGETPPRRGGTLHLASIGNLTTLDPALAADILTQSVLRLIYAGLVDFDTGGNVVPDLASRVEESEDGRVYRFLLREQVTFHDGAEVTAADVKRSIERALHPATPSPVASSYDAIEGFDDFTQNGAPRLTGVVVEGRYAVAIHLRQPDATFLRTLALDALRVTCASAGDRYLASSPPCGAGPFKLAPNGWERGSSLTLVRHEGYFRPGLPYLDAITWELGSTVLAERFKFGRGTLDLIRDLTQADVLRYRADARWSPFGEYEPSHEVRGEAMNVEMAPFDNVEVRRAVAAAIDRDHLVLLRASNLSPATKPVPPGMPGYDPPPDIGQRFDRAAALEHMKRAGYPFDPATGLGGWPRAIPYDVSKQSLPETTGQLIQQDLGRIGLHIELRVSSPATQSALTHRRGKSVMSPQGWDEDYPDPSDFLEPLFSTRFIADEDTTNFAFYSNPVLDGLLARARRERDPAARTALYSDAERIVCDDAPWAFEYANRAYHVRQPYVRGYQVHALWMDDLTGVWLDRAADRIASRDPFFRVRLGGRARASLEPSAPGRR